MDKTLRGSLPIVAGAYGDSFGVRVVCSGSSAFTDGTVITIPFLDEVKGEDLYVLVYGYLIHESAHIRSTDFGVFLIVSKVMLTKHFHDNYPARFKPFNAFTMEFFS